MTSPNTLPATGGVSDADVEAALQGMRFTATGIPKHEDMRRALEAFAQSRPPSNQSAGVVESAIPELFAKVGAAIASQDNRATDAPIFIVQQKRSYVTEEGYNESRHEWRKTESGDYSGPADDAEQERLDRFYSNEGHEPKGWKRFAVMDVWEFVTACFTEQGCKDFIAINGHNLKEPRIYAEGSYRNEEFRSIRKALIDLAAAPPLPPGRGMVPMTEQQDSAMNRALLRSSKVLCPIGLDVKGQSEFCSAGYCDECKKRRAGSGALGDGGSGE